MGTGRPERFGAAMDFRTLFQVLVIGGAMSGGATACGDEASPARVQDPNPESTSGDAGTQSHTGADAGSEEPGGGGVQGW